MVGLCVLTPESRPGGGITAPPPARLSRCAQWLMV